MQSNRLSLQDTDVGPLRQDAGIPRRPTRAAPCARRDQAVWQVAAAVRISRRQQIVRACYSNADYSFWVRSRCSTSLARGTFADLVALTMGARRRCLSGRLQRTEQQRASEASSRTRLEGGCQDGARTSRGCCTVQQDHDSGHAPWTGGSLVPCWTRMRRGWRRYWTHTASGAIACGEMEVARGPLARPMGRGAGSGSERGGSSGPANARRTRKLQGGLGATPGLSWHRATPRQWAGSAGKPRTRIGLLDLCNRPATPPREISDPYLELTRPVSPVYNPYLPDRAPSHPYHTHNAPRPPRPVSRPPRCVDCRHRLLTRSSF